MLKRFQTIVPSISKFKRFPFILLLLLAAVALLAFGWGPRPAQAQDAILGLEGPIESVVLNPDGSVCMTVMGGIRVEIPGGTPGTPISSPTTAVTAAQFTDPESLPGRTQAGVLGATTITTGLICSGRNIAADVFFEPAENVIIGTVTSATGDPIAIGGGPTFSALTLANTADRFDANPFVNDLGFEIESTSVAFGAAAAAEGYIANDGSGVFHYFDIAVSGGTLTHSRPQTSITRAQCEDGGRLNVLGNTTTPPPPGLTGTISIYNNDTNALVCEAISITVIADNTEFASYICREDIPNAITTTCPENIRAEDGNCVGADCAVSAVDIRAGAAAGPTCAELAPSIPACSTVADCGNGALDNGEQCDDGNNTPGDGCSATCLIEDPVFCPADFDEDGNVDGDDLASFAFDFGDPQCNPSP